MKNIIGNINKLRDIKEELARIDKYKYPYAYNALLEHIVQIHEHILKLHVQIKENIIEHKNQTQENEIR